MHILEDDLVYRTDVVEFRGSGYLLSLGRFAASVENEDVRLQGSARPPMKKSKLERVIGKSGHWFLRELPPWYPIDDLELEFGSRSGRKQVVLSYDDLPELSRNHFDQLQFRPIQGKNARQRVNHFLEGWYDDRVDHRLGGVRKWKRAFGAFFGDFLVGVVVVSPAYNPANNGDVAVISRKAAHPVMRPHNLSSWMLARVREWARDQDYERLKTFSGVDGNRGTSYKAAGFERLETSISKGTTWDDGGETWTRTPWVYDLEV